MLDVVSVVSAIAGSGIIMVGRDIWLARKTANNSAAAEKRNQAREPLIVESILLGNTTKIAEIYQSGITELADAKKRALEELRETRNRFETELAQVSQELERVRKENERKDQINRELYRSLGQLHEKLDKLQREKQSD